MYYNDGGNEGGIESHDDLRSLNAEAQRRILEDATDSRTEVIELAFEAVKKVAARDAASRKRAESMPEGSTYQLFTLDGLFDAAEIVELPVRTLSMLLEPDDKVLQSEEEQLAVYVPIPKDAPIYDDGFDFESLPEPEQVYVKRVWGNRSVSSFAVAQEGLISFSSVIEENAPVVEGQEPGERLTIEPRLSREIWSGVTSRIASGSPFVSRLHEDLVNMHVVPQRTIEVHHSSTQE